MARTVNAITHSYMFANLLKRKVKYATRQVGVWMRILCALVPSLLQGTVSPNLMRRSFHTDFTDSELRRSSVSSSAERFPPPLPQPLHVGTRSELLPSESIARQFATEKIPQGIIQNMAWNRNIFRSCRLCGNAVVRAGL